MCLILGGDTLRKGKKKKQFPKWVGSDFKVENNSAEDKMLINGVEQKW